MITDTLTALFLRELDTLQKELSAYTDEKNLWKTDRNISNSVGNLALHLVGNLNHFIGFQLGHTGYIRQRDKEFSDKDVALKTLLKQIEDTKSMIPPVLSKLTSEDLSKEVKVSDNHPIMTLELFLNYILVHLSYHLGQINYHRRLLDA